MPGKLLRVANDLRPALAGLDSVRERHTLVVKRLGPLADHAQLEAEARQTLRGAPKFEARVAGLGAFDEPAAGHGPVVYFAVESPRLVELHERLAETFGAIEGIEGEAYIPHITLGRGGSPERVQQLLATELEPVTWTVGELVFFDARHGEVVSRVRLPA